ncbi:DUF1800 domain-containing protein [Sphingomonas naphthae]|uniref:DUF1800 domain-containing protein n=1 Tax=Sphingomonas naphthae TaxID=1813468 RepID=A0ABY7TI42_9SPHN|nr:DUF1800 domain-containing protein [Sphingomonas naphthae]WCT72814.1 DUF1800 domain-containing protein [Sphingomonas naphthae]
MSAPSIALNRFGLGARPDEGAPADPKRWLLDQFDRYDPRPAPIAAQPDSAAVAKDYGGGLAAVRRMGKDDEEARRAARQAVVRDGRETYRAAVNARADAALATATPFLERMVHFWANHFAVSADKQIAAPFAGAFEAEAIRPHVMGRFSDMLLAVERHPGMQLFLDQARSAGPNSRLAERAAERNPERKLGLNENLAREILELHTLGARTGYSQADVTEFAKAMTGWSVAVRPPGAMAPAQADDATGGFVFRPAFHEPGARTILGRSYAQPGEEQARAVLLDLAAAPATAKHIATKLARHFVADDPPPALVARLSAAFTKSDGDLPTVYRALIEAPEAWDASAAKFKTPWDWLISAFRAMGRREAGNAQILPLSNQLGQPVWRPGSPAGWDDVAASWAAPDALVRRVELAQRFATTAGDRIDARALAPKLLPGTLAKATAEQIARAESAPTALALLLVSPDFLRRA